MPEFEKVFSCWRQTNILYSKQMCLLLNFLLCAVITRKKGAFQDFVDFTNILLYLSNRIPLHKQPCIIKNSKVTISARVSLHQQLFQDPEPCMPHNLVTVLPCQITLCTFPDVRTGSHSSFSASRWACNAWWGLLSCRHKYLNMANCCPWQKNLVNLYSLKLSIE